MDNCQRLCPNCPLVPPLVTAALISAEVVGERELRSFRFVQITPELAESYVGFTHIRTRVVASRRPYIEVGSTASMLVQTGGMGYTALQDAIRNCQGPRYNLLQRLLKFLKLRGHCGVMSRPRSL